MVCQNQLKISSTNSIRVCFNKFLLVECSVVTIYFIKDEFMLKKGFFFLLTQVLSSSALFAGAMGDVSTTSPLSGFVVGGGLGYGYLSAREASNLDDGTTNNPS